MADGEKLTLGLIVGNRGFFPDELAREGREIMIKQLKKQNFRNEKELQTFVEQNMESLFGIRFLASEFTTSKQHGGRIDSLGLDENNSPVIIEYKWGEKDNIINQGLFYLDWLVDHKGDFQLLVQNKLGNNVEVDFEASTSTSTTIDMQLFVGAWGNQISWEFYNADGEVIAEGSGYDNNESPNTRAVDSTRIFGERLSVGRVPTSSDEVEKRDTSSLLSGSRVSCRPCVLRNVDLLSCLPFTLYARTQRFCA